MTAGEAAGAAASGAAAGVAGATAGAGWVASAGGVFLAWATGQAAVSATRLNSARFSFMLVSNCLFDPHWQILPANASGSFQQPRCQLENLVKKPLKHWFYSFYAHSEGKLVQH